MLSKITAAVLLLVLFEGHAIAGSDPCNEQSCPAGTLVRVVGDKANPAFVCPTAELIDYITLIWGLTQLEATFGAKQRNISPVTGEPEYSGDTENLITARRHQASVETFDEAINLCKKQKPGARLQIANMPSAEKSSNAVFVFDAKAMATYWMPIYSLVPVKK